MILRQRGSHRPRLLAWLPGRTPTTNVATLAERGLGGNGDALLDAQDRRKNRRNLLAGGAAVLLIGMVTATTIYATNSKEDIEQDKQVVAEQRDTEAAKKESLASQILAECAARRLTGVICPNAAAAKADPPVSGGVTVEPSSEALAAAVSDYLAANPPPAGPGPTQAQIAAAVTAALLANPPAPGRAPTADEIGDAVADYLATNPPAAGDPGRPPTTAEIADAVEAYLQDNPPPKGDRGTDGDDGADGADGNPAQSQTFTTDDGRTFDCTRTAGSPDTAPAYACTQRTAPPPSSGAPPS